MDQEYKVKLDIFEGPLDLLLYLIKKDEVDIYAISIERITTQYLAYMDTFKMLNIELASEFIVMAANLMYIKSRNLLPRHQQPPEDETDDDDPRWELIRQLIEYKKFKDAAGYLEQREYEQMELFATLPELPEMKDEGPPPLKEVPIFELIRAFQSVLDRYREASELNEIVDETYTISDKIDYLLESVKPGEKMAFHRLFDAATTRGEVIVTFMALLELMKMNQFRVEQEEHLGEIEVIRMEHTLSEEITESTDESEAGIL